MEKSAKLSSLSRKDIENLQDLFRSSGPFVRERGLSDYWLYAELFSSTCIVAKNDAEIVAAIIAFRDQSKEFLEIYIQDVAVKSEWRNQGLGEILMKNLINRAEQWGVRRIWLTSEEENIIALKLWKKFDFKNYEADYCNGGLWVTRDLKGFGKDRVIYSRQ